MDLAVDIAGMLVLGVGVGLTSGALGLGGGIIMVPAFMTFVADMDTHTAKGTSLFIIIFVAALNAWRLTHGWEHRPWRLAALLAAGAIVGSYLGAWVTAQMPETVVLAIFIVLIALLAVRTFLLKTQVVDEAHLRRHDLLSVFIGLLTGIFAGATGTGGGSVLIPLALLAGIVTNARVVGLSNMVMVATAIAGSIAHLQADVIYPTPWTIGHIYFALVPVVFIGAQIGSPFGKRLNAHLTLPRRRTLMAGLLVLITARLVYRLAELM